MALSPKEMHDPIIENLASKTGHDWDHWHSVVASAPGALSDKELVAHLKTEHGLGHYTAVAVLKESMHGNEYNAADDLVAALFAGKPKAKELFEALNAQVSGLPGAERVACKTYIGYRAKKQFLIVAPSGKDSLRCSVALAPDAAGLSPASSFGAARIRPRFDLSEDGLADVQ